MLRGLLVIVVIAVLVFCGWALYNRGTQSAFGNGAVVHDSNRNGADTSATDIDGQPAEPTPSRSDAPGTINTVPAAQYQQNSANQPSAPNQQPTSYPSTAPNQIAAANQQPTPSNAPYAVPNAPYAVPTGPAPASDSLAPNPPNGVAFGGTGKYQWYRQGDLTWRVDTRNGASCVAFATMEQWSKPLVYTHGCGNS